MARTPTDVRSRTTALLLALVLLVAGLAQVVRPTPASAQEELPGTVTADALPTVQVDGVVWDTLVLGDRVYATGSFAYARPSGAAPGQDRTRRSNVLAFDLATGELLQQWDPVLDGQGLALAASTDGTRVYVAGDFTRVDGTPRSRVAALDARTGELVQRFRADANARVRALAVRGETLYLGGIFTVLGGQSRTRLAAVSASTGRMTSWAPAADAEVMALTWPQGTRRIVAAGRFAALNGVRARGMGALDAGTGATETWLANGTIQNYGGNSAVYSLSTQGSQVFGTAYDYYGPSEFEGSFAADAGSGRLDWLTGCRGDHYDAAPAGGVLYTVSHAHDCAPVGGNPETSPRQYQHAAATTTDASGGVNDGGAFSGQPAPTLLLDWLPSLQPGSYTGQSQAAWSVSTGSGYVVLGGEFPEVNGAGQQGLVRFGPRSQAPRAEGPIGYSGLQPELVVTSPGAVRASFTAAWDRDGHEMTYELLRGERYSTSDVVAQEVVGSSWWDRPGAVLVDPDAPGQATATYRVRVRDRDGNVMVSRTAVVETGPAAAGSDYAREVLADSPSAYWRLGEPSGTTVRDTVGEDDLVLAGSAVRGAPGPLEGDAATTLPGSSVTQGHSSRALAAPETFALEAWLRTTSRRGGKVLGFGTSRTGSSPSGYDRHVYLTDAGQLVFGVYPGTVRTVTSPGSYADGEWHHVVAQLGARGMELYVDGDLVASRARTTSAQPGLTGYWRVGGDNLSGWPSRPSSDALAGTVDEVAVYPTPLPGDRVAAHAAAGGVEPVAEEAPTASFAAEVSELSVAVDASGSSDPDGSVVSYAWDFGDGSTAQGATASHTYSAGGAYRVGLVVTDDDGLTSTAEQDVEVVAPAPGVVASDSFSRADAPSLGAAEAGGSWRRSGAGSSAAVVDGAARISVDPGRSATLGLPAVSATDVDLLQTIGLERSATGGGVYLAPLVRVTDAGEYRARLRLQADGSVLLALQTRVAGADRFLTAQTRVPGLSSAPGERLSVRVQASGTSPTRLRAKVWGAGSPEPSAWTQEVDDSTVQLQGPGAVGLWAYASGSMAAPALLHYDDVEAGDG